MGMNNWQFIQAIQEARLLLGARNVLFLKKASCHRIDSHSITIRLSTKSLLQYGHFAI